MRSSYLRMTRAQTVTVKRWRNQSSHDLKKQFEKFQHQRVTESPQCQDILARTRQGLASGEETECKIKLISNHLDSHPSVFVRGLISISMLDKDA